MTATSACIGKTKTEQQRRRDADQKYGEMLARHATDRLTRKVGHAARHEERDRQHVQAFEKSEPPDGAPKSNAKRR